MKAAFRNIFWVNLLMIFLISSCTYVPPRITNVRNFQMTKKPDNTQALVLEMQIENKNWVGFKLKNPLATVKLNGQEVGRADAPFNLKVKARSNNYQTIELSSNLNLSSLLLALLPTLQNGKVRIEVDGSLTVKSAFYKKPLVFKVDEEYSIKDLIQF